MHREGYWESSFLREKKIYRIKKKETKFELKWNILAEWSGKYFMKISWLFIVHWKTYFDKMIKQNKRKKKLETYFIVTLGKRNEDYETTVF